VIPGIIECQGKTTTENLVSGHEAARPPRQWRRPPRSCEQPHAVPRIQLDPPSCEPGRHLTDLRTPGLIGKHELFAQPYGYRVPLEVLAIGPKQDREHIGYGTAEERFFVQAAMLHLVSRATNQVTSSVRGPVVTGYGRGAYVYAGYSEFRQIPAAVPGALLKAREGREGVFAFAAAPCVGD
jgi:hypothetical protein